MVTQKNAARPKHGPRRSHGQIDLAAEVCHRDIVEGSVRHCARTGEIERKEKEVRAYLAAGERPPVMTTGQPILNNRPSRLVGRMVGQCQWMNPQLRI